jgi:hypothetical protein
MDGADNLVRRGQTETLSFSMFPISLCLDLLLAT